MRAITDSTTSFAALVTLDGLYEQVSINVPSILGYGHREIEGRPWPEFVHPDDENSAARAFQNLLQGEGIYNYDNRLCHKDGHYVRIFWTAFKANGSILAIGSTTRLLT